MSIKDIDQAGIAKDITTQILPVLLSGVVMVNPLLFPVIGIAWTAAQGLLVDKKSELGKRFKEFLTFVSQNKAYFDKTVSQDPHIVTGLIYLYERMMKERFE